MLLKNTMTSVLIIASALNRLPATPAIIRQSPVKSSPPTNTIIISPTGKIQPASVLESPWLAMLCTAALLDAPPNAINAPAMIPSSMHFSKGSFAFPSPAFIFASSTCAGELNALSISLYSFYFFLTAIPCRTPSVINKSIHHKTLCCPYFCDNTFIFLNYFVKAVENVFCIV
jgi:hypothetical protein